MANNDSSNSAGSAIWAVATLLVVVLLFSALYLGGIISSKKTLIDGKITTTNDR